MMMFRSRHYQPHCFLYNAWIMSSQRISSLLWLACTLSLINNGAVSAQAQQEVIVPDNYTTLKAAVDAGVENIFIRNGIYEIPSTIEISRPNVRIRGESAEGTILRKTGIASFILITNTENVTVQDVTLDAKTYDSPNNKIWEAFGVVNSNYTTLKNTIVNGSNHMFAVFIAGQLGIGGQPTIDGYCSNKLDRGNVVENNTIYSTFPGDVLSFSLQQMGRVSHNTVIGGVISFFMNKNSKCNHNHVLDSQTAGIFISTPAERNWITDNTILRSKAAGIKVARQIDHRDSKNNVITPTTYRAPGIVITGNYINDTRYFGMEIDQTLSAIVMDNTIEFVDFIGIYLLRSDRIMVSHNTIRDFGQSLHRVPVWQWNTDSNSGIYGDLGTLEATILSNVIVNATSAGTRFGIKITPNPLNVKNKVVQNSIHGSYTYNTIDVPPNRNNTNAANIIDPNPPIEWMTANDFAAHGNVESVESTEGDDDGDVFRFSSSSSGRSEFGVLLSSNGYYGDESDGHNVDFMVEILAQQQYMNITNGYESEIIIFFAPLGTYSNEVNQNDNEFGGTGGGHEFGSFDNNVIARLRYRIITQFGPGNNHTWFQLDANGATGTTSKDGQMTSGFLRIQRKDGKIYGYFISDDLSIDEWYPVDSGIELPPEYATGPMQVGIRIRKDYKTYHNFTVKASMIRNGALIDVPPAPTPAPTTLESTYTPIDFGSEAAPACESTLPQSTSPYETKGIGGGGAMSGLSISPWSDIWFVGTDMGTLFRSENRGRTWSPVSHLEARYHSILPVSGPVGFTTHPEVMLFAACHNDPLDDSSHPCVALRSDDAGLTWNAANVTGGSELSSDGKPLLDSNPKQWVTSLQNNSGYVLVSAHEGLYRSLDDGLTWSEAPVPSSHTNSPRGLFLDESIDPPLIFMGTPAGIYIWQDGDEVNARQLWNASESPLLSFSGGRTDNSGQVTLSFVDSNITDCDVDSQEDCGAVYIFSEALNGTELLALETFTFTKTSQRAYRVVLAQSDADVIYATGARSWERATGTSVWKGLWNASSVEFDFQLTFLQSDVYNSYAKWPADKLDYSSVGIDLGYWDGGYYTFAVNARNSNETGGSGNFFLHISRDGGEHWESPFTEYRDSCNTGGVRSAGERWSSAGIEMTSVRHLKFNPFNLSHGYASVADINMLKTLDGGDTWQISNSGFSGINTVYDYAFISEHIVIGVGGNFHDWPHGWYKNPIRGAGGAFISFDTGTSWRRLGQLISINCNNESKDVNCTITDDYGGQDMIRQVLSALYDESDGTLYIGTHAGGVARLAGLGAAIDSGYVDLVDALEWEWINNGLGSLATGLVVPEIKLFNGTIYALLAGDAPYYTNKDITGIYQWDHQDEIWIIHRGVLQWPAAVHTDYDLWVYPTSFDIDTITGTMWMTDMNSYNYLASGIWKSEDDGATWTRVQQYTYPFQVKVVGSRVYVTGEWSISRWGNAAEDDSDWGWGGLLYSDDAGLTWKKNEIVPLAANGAGATIDPNDSSKIFYTYFGGGMMYGPVPP